MGCNCRKMTLEERKAERAKRAQARIERREKIAATRAQPKQG